MAQVKPQIGHDEQRLAELGYKQELTRAWSGFTNFAISFTIISVLAGCFTNFSFAWTAGGPIGISIGWPVLCCFVLLVAFSMAELTSAMPTAGGPYWWAATLGGKGWSWLTGWFNLVGLVGIVSGVGYGAAQFLFATLSVDELTTFGFILTMYTQTGYDASAHTAEETRGAALGAAKGVWRSVFYSAIAGWAVLLALVFAASNVPAITEKGGGSIPIIETSLTTAAAKAVLLICTVGQLFCGAAGLTSCSRTWYAFSRARGMPGWTLFRRLNRARVPRYAVLAASVAALIITIPAYFGNKAGIPWAYFAITAICTVGLYLAYIIPVYLRLRQGDRFEAGPWTLGRHYRWVNAGAILFVVLVR